MFYKITLVQISSSLDSISRFESYGRFPGTSVDSVKPQFELNGLFSLPNPESSTVFAFGQHFRAKDNLKVQSGIGPWKISCLPAQKGEFPFILESNDIKYCLNCQIESAISG